MFPFGRSKEAEKQHEEKAEAKVPDGLTPTVGAAAPSYSRALRQPLFDTEWVLPESYRGPARLFCRPMGQCNDLNRAKTEVDTNLTMGGQLPVPTMFDFFRWRTEFSPDVPFEQVLGFRFASRLAFRFGPKIWWSVPLSFVPSMAYRSIEELKQIAPVLVCENTLERFAEAWAKAEIVRPGKEPKAAELLRDPRGIYRTEESAMVTKITGRPYRIKPNDTFSAEVSTDWDHPGKMPKDNFAVRLYLEGLLYVSI